MFITLIKLSLHAYEWLFWLQDEDERMSQDPQAKDKNLLEMKSSLHLSLI